MNDTKQAYIIGAGPAGLTAAYELLEKTDIVPIIIEKSSMVGGLARTVRYKGNRIDIGGHRFFSKSDRVIQWWLDIMPLEPGPNEHPLITYHGARHTVTSSVTRGQESSEERMLVRPRKSRIYYRGNLFEYPLTIDFSTLSKLGISSVLSIFLSYLHARLFPLADERNLENFFINRFGRHLYEIFFKSYTEKVWGVSCREIGAEWGRQRIKGLSIQSALDHALKKMCRVSIESKHAETSLIEQFLYPPLGPGQLWEIVARKIQERGGRILYDTELSRVVCSNNRIIEIEIESHASGEKRLYRGDCYFSTIPIKELIGKMGDSVPLPVREVAHGLSYRDFITVGMVVKNFRLKKNNHGVLSDNWLYIHDPAVRVGRIQIFNNWSPALVADTSTLWIGLEYFSSRGDGFWEKTDSELVDIAKDELMLLGIIEADDVLDATVIRAENAYPAYTGTYTHLDIVRNFFDAIHNVFLIGRNGMHKYNNQDHSMLTAMAAVECIVTKGMSKKMLWEINTEQDYHESNR